MVVVDGWLVLFGGFFWVGSLYSVVVEFRRLVGFCFRRVEETLKVRGLWFLIVYIEFIFFRIVF